MEEHSQADSEPDSAARSAQPADCYSAGERGWMTATQHWRGRLLQPWLRTLTKWRVSPNTLTLLSFLAGLAFCPIWFYHRAAALGLLLLHVLLDGLDGPLARHQGVASRQGSFTDSMSDQCVVTAFTVTLMADGIVSVVPGASYVFLYVLVVGFAMVRNALAVPYSWVVRPRFVVYVWLVIEITLWPGSMDWLLWVCNALLALKVLTGFVRIREKM